MSIKITCLQCGTQHKVNDRLAGRRVRCPQCDTAVHVPELPVDAVPVDAVPVEMEAVEAVEAEPVAVEAVAVEAEPIEAEPVAVEAIPAAAVAVVAASMDGSSDEQADSAARSGSGGSGDSTPPAVDLDDDDDEALPRQPREEDELDMTPMVDVTFLLLIFFVVTASFQLQKSIIMPRQQTDAPSTNSVEEDPDQLDQVELQIDEEGGFLVITDDGEKDPLGKQALVSTLREARADKDAMLIIKVQEQAKLQALVDGMDAGTIAGYSDLQVTQVEEL